LTNVRTTGDIQSAGLVITSKEKTGAGTRLLAVQTGSASTAPVILNQPQDQSLNLGDTISLSVSTDGSTSVAYQWKKDGVDIVGATGPALVITAAGLTDAGTYTCSVTNSYGTSTSAAATVAINTAPVVVKGLKNNTVYVDDTVTLSATFLGAPVPTYSWKKDGVTIPGATESSYTFIPESITGSGTYTVTAINTYGSISSSATVIVNASPTSFKNISNANFTYTQNFDGLEKSGTNGIRTTIYSPWTDGGINKDASCEGWYVATDASLSGYRTLNCSSSSNATCPPPESQSGVLSMGAASGTTERSLGGIPWVGNKIYMGLRLRNATGKVLHGCTVAFALEQMTATTLAKSDTLLNLAIQVNAASLKSGTWMSVTNFSPPTNASAYININGSGSSYSQSPSTNAVPGARSIKNITLNNLNVGQDQDLWIRWTFASTSSEPLAMGIDDLTINSMVLVNNPQTISFDLSKNTLAYGDSAPVVSASATSALPVTITSSAPGVVSVGPNNVLSVIGAGTATLTANQAGDSTWAAAPSIQKTVVVNPASQTITFALNPATAKVGDPNRLIIATSDADLAVSITNSLATRDASWLAPHCTLRKPIRASSFSNI
jgi:hypothetical protein